MKPSTLTEAVERDIIHAAKRYAARRAIAEVQVGYSDIADCQHWIARVRFDRLGEGEIVSWEHATAPGANEPLRSLEELRAIKLSEDKK